MVKQLEGRSLQLAHADCDIIHRQGILINSQLFLQLFRVGFIDVNFARLCYTQLDGFAHAVAAGDGQLGFSDLFAGDLHGKGRRFSAR